MKNYGTLIAKLQSRNPRIFCSLSIVENTRVKFGVTGIISIWRWAKNATNVSLHGCIFAIKHFFDKSLESQPLLHVLCCKKCSRSFKILQLQRLGINSQTHRHAHELIAITLCLRARVNYRIAKNVGGPKS